VCEFLHSASDLVCGGRILYVDGGANRRAAHVHADTVLSTIRSVNLEKHVRHRLRGPGILHREHVHSALRRSGFLNARRCDERIGTNGSARTRNCRAMACYGVAYDVRGAERRANLRIGVTTRRRAHALVRAPVTATVTIPVSVR
jgi:hypothetical protein